MQRDLTDCLALLVTGSAEDWHMKTGFDASQRERKRWFSPAA
jgi:hypothetical protein